VIQGALGWGGWGGLPRGLFPFNLPPDLAHFAFDFPAIPVIPPLALGVVDGKKFIRLSGKILEMFGASWGRVRR